MRRREFITLLGGAAAAWPLSARAQQGERMRRVGVLSGSAPDDPDAQARLAALRQGLQQLGWIEGRNLQIDARWGAGDAAETRKAATELAAPRRTSSCQAAARERALSCRQRGTCRPYS